VEHQKPAPRAGTLPALLAALAFQVYSQLENSACLAKAGITLSLWL